MRVLAIDLGAESGRVIEGKLEKHELTTKEIHRFPNKPLKVGGTLRWDLQSLEQQIQRGIGKAEGGFASVGVDGWGVDFVLLGEDGNPIEPPYHYRDARTDGIMAKAFEVVPREEIYEQTGIQFLPFNSLYQLYSMVLSKDPALLRAKRFFTIPDYFTYRLTESEWTDAGCEFTNATTTQCFDPRKDAWADELLEGLDIPRTLFPKIVRTGTIAGIMSCGAKVIAPACHDTGSAVAAVPAQNENFAFISSGTWSVMGIESKKPIINSETCQASFTNEGGAGGSFRFCKNVMGLWILQQCRAQWELEGASVSYEQLVNLAEEAEPAKNLIDPDDPIFLKPGDMPARIDAWLKARNYSIPSSKGQFTRLVLESLAAKYKVVLDQLERLSGRRIESIHIIGGGSQNRLLNELTAKACQVPVIAGPVEATAIGNILLQLISLGEISSVQEGRAIVREGLASS